MKSVVMPGASHIRKVKQAHLAYTYTNFRRILAMLKSVFILFIHLLFEG